MKLIDEIREDLSVYPSWRDPGFHAVAVHRIGVWRRARGPSRRAVLTLPYYALQLVVRYVYGISLTAPTQVGRRLRIASSGNVSIHPNTVIGDDCLIRHNVTLGLVKDGTTGAPQLGKGVEIGPGAVIAGPITIGDGVKIGPNAVVLQNVPGGAIVMAPPGRIIG